MNRHLSLVIVAIVSLVATLQAEEPAKRQDDGVPYRIILRNLAGQLSMPDEPRNKTHFLDLDKVVDQLAPPQYFGGRSRNRFKAIAFDRINQKLTCEEVATKKTFTLEVGQQLKIVVKPE